MSKEPFVDNPDGNALVLLDQQFKILEMNQNAKAIFSVSRSFVGLDYFELCQKKSLEPVFHPIFAKQLLTYEKKCTTVFSGQGNQDVMLSWVVSCFLNPVSGKLNYRLAGNILEGQVGSSHIDDYFMTVINNLPGYLYLKDIHSVYLKCNENFAKAAGLNFPEEVIGKTDYDLAWGQTEADTFRKGDLEVLSGKDKFDFEEFQTQSDGRITTVLASKVALKDKQNNTIGVLGVYTDITERKKTEEELAVSKSKAEAANKAKSEFIANVSHDLKTPLHGILGAADILKLKKHSLEQQEYLDGIYASARALLSLVEDILDFSKVESKNFKFHCDRFKLKEFLEDLLKGVAVQGKLKDLDFNIDLQGIDDVFVSCDMQAIRRILLNLLGNALKFTNKGSISFTVRRYGKAVRQSNFEIKIQDTGIGIDDEKLQHIFDRFYRVEPSYLGSKYKGSGLGLAISQQLIEGLGGTIDVESRLGEGTTFTLLLPLKIVRPAKGSAIKKSMTLSNEISSYGLRILLVEDEALSQKVSSVFLEQLGCTVDSASSGREALEMLNDKHDLIFLDIGLPDMNGFEVAKQVRTIGSKKAKVPICALTAHVVREDDMLFHDVGVDYFLRKPACMEELEKIVAIVHRQLTR